MGYERRPEVTASPDHLAVNSPRHSQELAQQLVRRFGIQGATRTCMENHWQGVLEIIHGMNHKP